jgi:toxin YoeB
MAKRKIIWSPDANLDMLNILEYFYKRNGTKTYSKKLYFKIRKSVRLLSKHPFLGIQTDDENIRNLIEGDYAIFYKLDEETIYILSIFDCRQDPESLTLQK